MSLLRARGVDEYFLEPLYVLKAYTALEHSNTWQADYVFNNGINLIYLIRTSHTPVYFPDEVKITVLKQVLYEELKMRMKQETCSIF